MKFCNETERRIYAAAFATEYSRRHDAGPQACHREIAEKEKREVIECWEATIAMWAIDDAEAFVMLHRKGLRERRQS